MDIEMLKEMVEPDALADYLGLDYQEKSGRFLILCPFHGDRNLGSAYIRKGYFHCFSCGESMDIVTLVMRVQNVGFYKAIKILASLAGVSISFDCLNDGNGYYRYRLNQEELEVLKFPKSVISLRKIYNASPQQYKEIVTDKTKEQLSHYEDILQKYSERYLPDAYKICELYSGNVCPQTFRDIKTEAKHRIRLCHQILERFE